jgi:hypothetical protein
MRYGAIPIVRAVGGLKDTVPDIGEPGGSGRGIRFDQFALEDAFHAIYRAASMWQNDPGTLHWLRHKIMAIDFSWESAVQIYFQTYRQIGAQLEFGLTIPPDNNPEAQNPAEKTAEIETISEKPAKKSKAGSARKK